MKGDDDYLKWLDQCSARKVLAGAETAGSLHRSSGIPPASDIEIMMRERFSAEPYYLGEGCPDAGTDAMVKSLYGFLATERILFAEHYQGQIMSEKMPLAGEGQHENSACDGPADFFLLS